MPLSPERMGKLSGRLFADTTLCICDTWRRYLTAVSVIPDDVPSCFGSVPIVHKNLLLHYAFFITLSSLPRQQRHPSAVDETEVTDFAARWLALFSSDTDVEHLRSWSSVMSVKWPYSGV